MERATSTSMPSQDVMDHSHKESNAFNSASRRDAYMSASGSNANALVGFSGRRKAPMRPSMELRCKQLDLSLLQVRTASGPLHSCQYDGCMFQANHDCFYMMSNDVAYFWKRSFEEGQPVGHFNDCPRMGMGLDTSPKIHDFVEPSGELASRSVAGCVAGETETSVRGIQHDSGSRGGACCWQRTI